MDLYCADVSIALYEHPDAGSAIVHSYSERTGVTDRVDWIAAAMRELGGMTGDGKSVAFPCGALHERAICRLFLDVCRIDPSTPRLPRPLTALDPRTERTVVAESRAGGTYRIGTTGGDTTALARDSAIAAGLAKVAELQVDDDDTTIIRFPCGASHDGLVGVLLPRAINVRATLREQELAATKGILVAPSTQNGAVSD